MGRFLWQLLCCEVTGVRVVSNCVRETADSDRVAILGVGAGLLLFNLGCCGGLFCCFVGVYGWGSWVVGCSL